MTAQIVIAFIFGVVFVVALIGLAIAFPKPTPFQYTVFRIVLSLAASGVAAMVPGFIKMELNPVTGLIVRAGGALAVFAIIFFCNPARLAGHTDSGADLPGRIGDNPTLRSVWDLLDPPPTRCSCDCNE